MNNADLYKLILCHFVYEEIFKEKEGGHLEITGKTSKVYV